MKINNLINLHNPLNNNKRKKELFNNPLKKNLIFAKFFIRMIKHKKNINDIKIILIIIKLKITLIKTSAQST